MYLYELSFYRQILDQSLLRAYSILYTYVIYIPVTHRNSLILNSFQETCHFQSSPANLESASTGTDTLTDSMLPDPFMRLSSRSRGATKRY